MDAIRRNSFVFYRSFFDAIEKLPKSRQLAVYRAIAKYGLDCEEPTLDGVSEMIFALIRPNLDANLKKYLNGLKGGEKGFLGAEYGKRGGRPKKETPQEPPKERSNNPPNNPPNVLCIMNNELCIMDNDNKQSEDKSSSCSPKRQPAVTFGYDTDAKIHGITPELMEYWKKQFPAVDIEQEIRSAEAWLDSNRVKRKHDIKRFITSWLTRTQEKASARATTPQSNTYTQRRQYSGFDGNVHPAVSAEDREAYNGF